MFLSFHRVDKNVVTPSFHCVSDALWDLLGTGCARTHVTVSDISHNGIKRLWSCQQHQICQKKKGKDFKQLSSVGRAYILLKALIYHLSFNAFFASVRNMQWLHCGLSSLMHHQLIWLALPARFFYSTQNTEQLKIMMKTTTNYGVALYKLPACWHMLFLLWRWQTNF